MGLLDGKNALIFGVANDHSIAWGIAKALHEHGAVVGFSSVEASSRSASGRWRRASTRTFVEPCDVRDDEQIASRLRELGRRRHGQLDILVHALAFANREDLDGAFVDDLPGRLRPRPRRLRLLARGPRPRGPPVPAPRLERPDAHLLRRREGRRPLQRHGRREGGPGGVASATWPPTSGPTGIRVNAISARARSGRSRRPASPASRRCTGRFRDVAPLRSNITIEDVAGTAVYLASDLAGAGDRRDDLRGRRLQRPRCPDVRDVAAPSGLSDATAAVAAQANARSGGRGPPSNARLASSDADASRPPRRRRSPSSRRRPGSRGGRDRRREGRGTPRARSRRGRDGRARAPRERRGSGRPWRGSSPDRRSRQRSTSSAPVTWPVGPRQDLDQRRRWGVQRRPRAAQVLAHGSPTTRRRGASGRAGNPMRSRRSIGRTWRQSPRLLQRVAVAWSSV